MQTETVNIENLFDNLDFRTLTENPDFKEDSVREVIILPILEALGYTQPNIVRSKTLQHPFLKIGSKKRPINLVPDYVLKVENNFAWVLDAKAPNQKIADGDNVEQVYSYATHPESRSNYFALCNGLEFSLFRTIETNTPILFFKVDEIEQHWESLKSYLSPDRFQIGKSFTYGTTTATAKPKGEFDYRNRPLLEEIPVKKQQAKRHFGVHGYFTKQTWNVVAEYIKNYSKPGDLVLDPFGGSGVTAIEALMNRRRAISIDINPLAIFIVQSLLAPVNWAELAAAFQRVEDEYKGKEPNTDEEVRKALKKYPYPKGFLLPKGSDVSTVEQLFSSKQLAQLSLLKSVIKKEKNESIKMSLMLMFSGLLNKINLTYHASEGRSEGRGDSSIFRYYRYRIAKEPGTIDILPYFRSRFKKVSEAKKEIDYFINEETIEEGQIIKGSATHLSFIPKRVF